jgi:tRNA(Ile)-lysidine synthase
MVDRGIACRAIHVDHGLPDSPVMRRAAEAVAATLGIELEVQEVEVPVGASPENQARIVRYAALESALADDERLVTGHTRDDQAETVLLNLMRGTGLDGLRGIPRSRGRVIRPILSVTRSETRELATLLGVPWHDDPSNNDEDPRRNQIRRIVMPDLEARFNPRLRATLATLAETLQGEFPGGRSPVRIHETEDGLAMAAPELHSVGPHAAAQAFREAVRRIRGPHAGTRTEIERLAAVADGSSPMAELSGGIRVFRRGPWLVLERAAERPDRIPQPWIVPGSIEFGGWVLDSWSESRAPNAFPLSAWTAVADADLFPIRTTVRTTGRGDVIDGVPVSEVLRQVGVSANERMDWPIVDSGEAVIWVPGARISRSVWVGSTTRRYLWVNAVLESL